MAQISDWPKIAWQESPPKASEHLTDSLEVDAVELGESAGAVLTQEAFDQILSDQGVTQAAYEYIQAAISEAPSRAVSNSSGRSLIGEFHSRVPAGIGTRDTRWRLQFESLSGEFAFLTIATADPDLRLIADQPTAVPITITDKIGRKRRTTYTPDFLLVYHDRIRVVEVKPARKLAALCSSRPNDWRKDGSTYRYLPAESAFEAIGVPFEVVTNESLSWIKVQNLQLLSTVTGAKVGEDIRNRILNAIPANAPCSIDQLIRTVGLENAIPILSLVASGKIQVDLENAALSDPRSGILCSSASLAAEIGESIRQLRRLTCTDQSIELADLGNERAQFELGFRLSILEGQQATGLNGGWAPSRRTILRWRRQLSEVGPKGLVPQWHKCGNRAPRVPAWHAELAFAQVRQDRSCTTRPTRKQSYIRYKKQLAKVGADRGVKEQPFSYQHYCRLWNSPQHQVADARKKGGRRLANAVQPHLDVDLQEALATRPFQVAHIDHCLAPCLVICPGEDAPRQPWITALIDQFSPEPLAWIWRFDPPSFAANGLVVRACIRRHGRFPYSVVSDNGPDFRGLQFKGCMAELGANAILRPPASGRAGQPVERTFGSFATVVCAGAAGFLPDSLKSRAVSRSKHPRNLPARQSEDFEADMEEFFMQRIPSLRPPNGGPSPLEKRLQFEAIYGEQGVKRKLDLAVLIATSKPIETTGKTEPAGAIRFDETRFYAPSLRGLCVSVATLSPRRDPEDESIIYFAHEGRWHIAKARSELLERGSTTYATAGRARDRRKLTKEERDSRDMLLHRRPEPPAIAEVSLGIDLIEEASADGLGAGETNLDEQHWEQAEELASPKTSNPAWKAKL